MVQYKWLVISNTTLGQMMAVIDANIVIIALPSIGRNLPGTSAIDLIWIIIGYSLVLASLMVNLGRLGDILGRVRVYKLGFIIFTLGSGLCSISQDGAQLVGFRLVQGVGAALLFANATAMVVDAFPPEERGKAMGMNGIAVASGSVIGLVVGGFLTGSAGWRSVFWVNIPIGLFAIVWSQVHLKEIGKINRNQKIDYLGNGTFVVGLTILLAAITLFALSALDDITFSLAMAASVAILGFFVYIERRVEFPMLKLALFKVKAFSVANLIAFVVSLASGTTLLVLTFYLQGPTMKLTPFEAGVFLAPNAAAILLGAPISGTLSDRFGRNIFTTIGPLMGLISCLFLAQLGPSISFVALAPLLFFQGIGMSFFQPSNRATVMSAVGPEDRGLATGIYMTAQNVGMILSRGFAFLVMGLTLTVVELEAIFDGKTVGPGAIQISSTDFLNSVHLVFYVSSAVLATSVVLSVLRISGAIGAQPEGGNRIPLQQPEAKVVHGPGPRAVPDASADVGGADPDEASAAKDEATPPAGE